MCAHATAGNWCEAACGSGIAALQLCLPGAGRGGVPVATWAGGSVKTRGRTRFGLCHRTRTRGSPRAAPPPRPAGRERAAARAAALPLGARPRRGARRWPPPPTPWSWVEAGGPPRVTGGAVTPDGPRSAPPRTAGSGERPGTCRSLFRGGGGGRRRWRPVRGRGQGPTTRGGHAARAPTHPPLRPCARRPPGALPQPATQDRGRPQARMGDFTAG
jgi:hypothetical protein